MENKKRKWIEAISNGDEQAFRVFFEHYYPRLYGYALTFLNSHSQSEESVADVFMKVWRNKKNIVVIKNIDHYMFRAVKNQALNYLKRKSLITVKLDEVDFEASDFFIQQDPSILDNELAIQIQTAINSLPPRSRLIFGLIRQDRLKYKEVAEQLDLSVRTVENQMNIALKKIRKKINPYLHI